MLDDASGSGRPVSQIPTAAGPGDNLKRLPARDTSTVVPIAVSSGTHRQLTRKV